MNIRIQYPFAALVLSVMLLFHCSHLEASAFPIAQQIDLDDMSSALASALSRELGKSNPFGGPLKSLSPGFRLFTGP